eukprot:6187317-Pleurochrysis_carterae.AAC.2
MPYLPCCVKALKTFWVIIGHTCRKIFTERERQPVLDIPTEMRVVSGSGEKDEHLAASRTGSLSMSFALKPWATSPMLSCTTDETCETNVRERKIESGSREWKAGAEQGDERGGEGARF